jgi:hypothetical protein
MPTLEQHITDFFTRHPGKGAADVPPLEGRKIPRQTLTRRLGSLVERGELIRVGAARASRYFAGDLQAYFETPAALRAPVAYRAERASEGLPRFTPGQLRVLKEAGGTHGATAEDATRAVRERLLVELSYASSSLEGNTYDLIQTGALIQYGQLARGKTAQEAKMILNHRDAIRHLLDNISTVAIDWPTLRDLHALLSDGLLDDAADSGRVRRRLVTITHSAYTPPDNEYQVREAVDAMLAAVNEERDPFNQSLMLMAGIAYVQIFADCNKRTGRVMANLPLLRASLPPLSFITVDKEAYTRGLLTYYELGNGRMLAKAYADAYPSSARAYDLTSGRRPKSPEQMAAELRYQEFVRARLRDIVLGRSKADAPLPESIAAPDREAVEKMIHDQLTSLHPGRAAPLAVTAAQIEAYLSRREN